MTARLWYHHFNSRFHLESSFVVLQIDNHLQNFNSRSPSGERLGSSFGNGEKMVFQFSLPPWGVIYDSALFLSLLTILIHAPHMESDKEVLFVLKSADDFNSSLPAWGATFGRNNSARGYFISILAPGMGSDVPSHASRL